MKLSALFKNPRASRTFLILFLGFVVIQCAALFVFFNYRSRTQYRLNERQLITKLTRDLHLATAIPPDALPQHIRDFDSPGIVFRILEKPMPKAQTLFVVSRGVIRYLVRQHPNHLRLNVRLLNGKWLFVRVNMPQHPYLFAGFLISMGVLLFALIALCYWAVRRLMLPLSAFTKATARFGLDLQAPPMAEYGPPEMRDLIRAYNEMQNRVRRLIDDRTEMLAAISHDLRTPITRLQLRMEYWQGTAHYEKAVRDLQEMENMIQSILAFARDYTRTEVMETFDLDALIETICDDLVDAGKDVTYATTLSRYPFLGRLSGMRRALTNLIENAVKYGTRAEVSLSKTNDFLHIKIEDNGPGIPEDKLEKVFRPFYRVDTARTPTIKGVGLGLAVARDIIRGHGGDITLLNREPNGLIVQVVLPLPGTPGIVE